MKIFKQCWALTKDFKKCKNKTKFLVCKIPTHRFQILSASVITIGLIITIIGTITTIYSGITSSKANDDIYINTVEVLNNTKDIIERQKGHSKDLQKITTLLIENQDYKKKYEEVLKELASLKNINKNVKDQIFNAIQKKDFKTAQKLVTNLRTNEKKVQKQHAKIAKLQGDIFYLQLNYKEALRCYFEAHKLDEENSEYLNVIGVIFSTIADYKKAIEYYDNAFKSYLKTYGAEHPYVARSWSNLGGAYHFLGEYQKEKEYYEKALEIGLKTYGAEHPDVAVYWNNLGRAYDSLGEYRKAIEFLEKALKSNLKTYGAEHPYVATCWNNLGAAYASLGKYKKAIEYYEKALKVLEIKLGMNHPTTKKVRNNLEKAKKKLKN